MGRRRARRIAGHAQEHLLEFGRAVRRRQHALQSVAADAHGEERLLLGLARHAVEPFGAGQLRHEILAAPSLRSAVAVAPAAISLSSGRQIVADGPDRDRVLAGFEPVRREAVAAFFVGHDGDRDGRARFLALTSTPSIAGSAAEDTWPVSAADCACAGARPACSRTKPRRQ